MASRSRAWRACSRASPCGDALCTALRQTGGLPRAGRAATGTHDRQHRELFLFQAREQAGLNERGLSAAGVAVEHTEAKLAMDDLLQDCRDINITPIETIAVGFLKGQKSAKGRSLG